MHENKLPQNTQVSQTSEHRLPALPLDSIRFGSASEYACCALLEKYCEGWRAMPGATVQIPIGRCIFDFRVENTLIEYHPISLRHEFLTSGLNKILSATDRLRRDDRMRVLDALADEFQAQYSRRRSQIVAAHPSYSHLEVLCVFSQEEFARSVVQRFSPSCEVGVKALAGEFRSLLRSVYRKRQGD